MITNNTTASRARTRRPQVAHWSECSEPRRACTPCVPQTDPLDPDQTYPSPRAPVGGPATEWWSWGGAASARPATVTASLTSKARKRPNKQQVSDRTRTSCARKNTVARRTALFYRTASADVGVRRGRPPGSTERPPPLPQPLRPGEKRWERASKFCT